MQVKTKKHNFAENAGVCFFCAIRFLIVTVFHYTIIEGLKKTIKTFSNACINIYDKDT